MVAEATAWVFNMTTVPVLFTPCFALSNLSLIFDSPVFDGAKTMRCCADVWKDVALMFVSP